MGMSRSAGSGEGMRKTRAVRARTVAIQSVGGHDRIDSAAGSELIGFPLAAAISVRWATLRLG
jgi:hypothetical protein